MAIVNIDIWHFSVIEPPNFIDFSVATPPGYDEKGLCMILNKLGYTLIRLSVGQCDGISIAVEL
ncbi:hypothetical protein Rhsp01_58180 [Rhizobium sp. NBRC 114257]|uniref:Uncharacterized protein n=1 Tax=Rhizobium dioscoreae TaxID=2653122 RepID=A0ABQ0ZDC3_9HYPH|nr:hypothetical protein RsS93_58170 [Rhizobium dioscoreae]GLU84642.1 hypothetical protein Rhsp01_58180 [Rhizobium sp. NBRC 114257]